MPSAPAPVALAPPTSYMGLGVQAPDAPGYSMPTAVSATMTTDAPPPTKEDNTIGAQENLKISGRDARHMVMQKLMRQTDEVRVVSSLTTLHTARQSHVIMSNDTIGFLVSFVSPFWLAT